MLGVDRRPRCRSNSVPLPRWLWVASGTSSRIRSTSPSPKPGFEQALGRSVPDEALGARAGVDAPRLDADHAPNTIGGRRGDPDQLRDLLCRQAGDRRACARAGIAPRSGPRRAERADARRCGSRCARRASRRGRLRRSRPGRSPRRRALESATCARLSGLGSRSTVQEISAAKVFSCPSCRIRIAFCTPVTPALVSPS